MPALISEVLSWVRTGFPDGVPDAEAPALFAVLTERLGTERAQEVLRQLSVDGRLTPQAASSLLADDVQKRQVAAKLVLGGWPLGPAEDAEPEPPQEGGALGRIVAWLREGYPGGVPDHDYIPLLALLERRLTKSEVKQIARSLRRADVSPAGPRTSPQRSPNTPWSSRVTPICAGCAISWPSRAGRSTSPTRTRSRRTESPKTRNARPGPTRTGVPSSVLGLRPPRPGAGPSAAAAGRPAAGVGV